MCKPLQRALSFVLTLVLIFQLLPLNVFAAETQQTDDLDIQNWTMPEKEEPDVVGEVEELREHTVKQFRLSDGSFAAVNYGIPVHYQDDNENWVDVDNTLVYASNVSQYRSVNGNEQRGFADVLTSSQPVLVSQYEDYTVELTLLPMTYEAEVVEQESLNLIEWEANADESEPINEATETTTEPTEETEITQVTEATESVSETTAPVETVPETTIPEETTAETTEPAESVDETTLPPETTIPVETVPETTQPEETTIPETSEATESESEPETETVGPSSVAAVIVNPGDTALYSAREDLPLSE